VAPPRRGPTQPEQARRLRGDAVRRHELLLLADRAEEAERVDAEAEHAEHSQRQQAEDRGEGHADPRASGGGAEHEERQHDPRAQLDADTGDERGGARTRTGGGARAQGQRECQRQQDERVVVRAADGQHEQHRVQPDERRRPGGRAAQARGGARRQRDGTEARGGGERFQEPQPAGEPQRRGHVAREREQRAVGGVLEGPADERERGISRGFGGEVRVGIQAMQRSHPREREVPENVLGDQRGTQRQDDMREHDRARQRERRQRARGEEHEQVAGAHHEHQRLEGGTAEARAEARERTRQPAGPAAAAAGNVLGGRGSGARVEQEDGGEHAGQAEGAEGAHYARRHARRLASGPPGRRCALDARAGYGGCGLDDAHCYVCLSCKGPA
jgi:hypothetical protein